MQLNSWTCQLDVSAAFNTKCFQVFTLHSILWRASVFRFCYTVESVFTKCGDFHTLQKCEVSGQRWQNLQNGWCYRTITQSLESEVRWRVSYGISTHGCQTELTWYRVIDLIIEVWPNDFIVYDYIFILFVNNSIWCWNKKSIVLVWKKWGILINKGSDNSFIVSVIYRAETYPFIIDLCSYTLIIWTFIHHKIQGDSLPCLQIACFIHNLLIIFYQ